MLAIEKNYLISFLSRINYVLSKKKLSHLEKYISISKTNSCITVSKTFDPEFVKAFL